MLSQTDIVSLLNDEYANYETHEGYQPAVLAFLNQVKRSLEKRVIDQVSAPPSEWPDVKGESETYQQIVQRCKDLCTTLCRKNKSYGDSASDPVDVFSAHLGLTPADKLAIRMDDKLSRLTRGDAGSIKSSDEQLTDTWKDLAGYIVLMAIVREDPSWATQSTDG